MAAITSVYSCPMNSLSTLSDLLMEAAELSTASPSAMDVTGAGGKGKHLGTGYPGRDKARGLWQMVRNGLIAGLLGWYPRD